MQRQTKQRQAIEHVFKRESRPLTPTEVFEGAIATSKGIGMRTVYRQIKDMVGEGLIVGIDYPGQPLRYEWVKHQHHSHFICRKCQRVFDLDVETKDVEVDAPDGFEITGQETIFYGKCPECGKCRQD